LITLPQWTISPTSSRPNSSGVPPAGSAAIFSIASRPLDFASALLAAALSRRTISFGVRFAPAPAFSG
jgi:hypothetical protein